VPDSRLVPANARLRARLREHALGYPEAYEEFPWGESVAKVAKKIFVFFGTEETPGVGLSVKLPGSSYLALELPFATRTGYGLGKAGWVTARFAPGEKAPLDTLLAWIEESYRAVAPAKLVARLDGAVVEPEPRRRRRA
jgi:predicted DNA-binding protein (MmcQ/YjbR family)